MTGKAEILAKAGEKLGETNLTKVAQQADYIPDLGYRFVLPTGQWIFGFDGGTLWCEATMSRDEAIKSYHQDR